MSNFFQTKVAVLPEEKRTGECQLENSISDSFFERAIETHLSEVENVSSKEEETDVMEL